MLAGQRMLVADQKPASTGPCGMQSVGDVGSLGVLCRFALNR